MDTVKRVTYHNFLFLRSFLITKKQVSFFFENVCSKKKQKHSNNTTKVKSTHVIHSPHLKTVHLWTVYCVSFCTQICKSNAHIFIHCFPVQEIAGLGLWRQGRTPGKQEPSSVQSDVPCNTRFPLLLHSREMLAAAGLPMRGFSSTLVSPISLLPAHMLCLYDFSPKSLASLKDYWSCPSGVPSIVKSCARPVLHELLGHRHPLSCLTGPLFPFSALPPRPWSGFQVSLSFIDDGYL